MLLVRMRVVRHMTVPTHPVLARSHRISFWRRSIRPLASPLRSKNTCVLGGKI